MLRRILILALCSGALWPGEPQLNQPEEVQAYVRKATAMRNGVRSKLQMMIESFLKPRESGGLGIEYNNDYTRTVEEVWRDRKANCLSLTLFYVAAARSIGIDAHFAQALNTQRWRRVGSMIRYERHVVALVHVPPLDDVVADFLPQLRKRWGVYVVSILPDERLLALFHSNRAVELLDLGNREAAMSEADLSVQVDPTSSVGWNIRGVVLRANGDEINAEASFRKALALDPMDSSCVGNLETQMRDLGRAEESARFRAMGLQIRKKDPYFHAFISEEALNEGNLDEAQKQINIALKLQPYEPEFYLLLARLKILNGKLDEAIKAIEVARRWATPGERERYDSKLAHLRDRKKEGDPKK